MNVHFWSALGDCNPSASEAKKRRRGEGSLLEGPGPAACPVGPPPSLISAHIQTQKIIPLVDRLRAGGLKGCLASSPWQGHHQKP